MVALIIISLLTFFCVNAVEPPSIYQRNDQNETKGESIKSPKILTYGVNLGANGEKYFSSITKVLATFECLVLAPKVNRGNTQSNFR